MIAGTIVFGIIFDARAITVADVQVSSVQVSSVQVSDGDSLNVAGQRYRLQGIDAPELHQTCRDKAGREWPCGEEARRQLQKLIGRAPLNCRDEGGDRYGRTIAVCMAGGRDLGEAMVRAGYAVTLKGRRVHSPYGATEQEARAAKRGIWSGTFEAPWAFREEHRREEGILPQAVRDWLRETSDAVKRRVWDWWRRM